MTVNPSDWQQLYTSFEQDLATTQQLHTRLEQERKALESRDYDQFQKIIGEKQTLLALLESHVKRRQQWLTKAGFSDDRQALEAARQQAPNVANLWLKLEQQWQQCQQLNEVNERIAKRTKIVVGQILDVLRGKANQPHLYTEKGNTQISGEGRTISNA